MKRTDAEGAVTAVRYDLLGRVVEVTDPRTGRTGYAYDEVGNLVEIVDGAGQTVFFDYDARGLLVRRHDAAGAGGDLQGVDDVFAYGALGRPVLAKNAIQTLLVEYDLLDRPVALTGPPFGTARRSYDADGRISQVVYPGGDFGFEEVVTNYHFDPRGQLAAIVDPEAGFWQFTHDALGRLVRRSDARGLERRVRFTPEGWLAEVEILQHGSVVDAFAYTNHDALGNPRSIASPDDPTPSDPSPTLVAYDARSQITAVTYPGGTESESFAYDQLGNRRRHTGRDGIARRYDYDPARHLLATIVDTTAVPEAELVAFEHDGAGRRTKKTEGGAATTYGYDGLGRLVQTAPLVNLYYDPSGHRHTRTDPSGTSVYFGEWVELRGPDRYRLIHGGGIDNVLAEVRADPLGPELRSLFQDGSANVARVAVTDPGGATTFEAPRRYEAFGAVRSGSSVVERGFAGRPPEGATGLVYLRARHYDPATGAFLQPDPLGIEASALYAYANSNPYVFWDPFGLEQARQATGGDRTFDFSRVPASPRDKPSSLARFASALGIRSGSGVSLATTVGDVAGVASNIPGLNVLASTVEIGARLYEGDLSGALTASTGLVPFGRLASNVGRLGVRAARGVQFKRWQRGEAIDKPLRDGSAPSFDVVRSRYWKNRYEAARDTGEFSRANLARMRRGSAPQDYNPRTGAWESRELHHHVPQRSGGSDGPLNLREVTPGQHRALDPHRR